MVYTKTFKRKETEFEIGSFDQDKEIEFCMWKDFESQSVSIWLSANQVTELITHLAQCLKSANDHVDIL